MNVSSTRLIYSYTHVGASFSGNRAEPYHYPKTNQTLYFRGARILDAILDTLLEDHGLDKATDVLLAGGSAGGLSTFLHADHVGAYLRAKGVPIKTFQSGSSERIFPDARHRVGQALVS